MASEETPLLAEQIKHDQIYDRFDAKRKLVITSLVCWCGLLPLFVSGTFMPVIPDIAKDLNSTGPIVSLAVSLSIFGASLGGLIGAAYSTFYGRRPVYLVSLPLCAISSVGVASSQTIPQLFIMRILQSLAASPGIAVGAGAIGDMYRLEERGTAMGVFFAAILLGPALAPLAGGVAGHYFSWRIMQIAIGVASLLAFTLMAFLFPETSHPGMRGIDKWRRVNGGDGSFRFVWVNPLSPLSLLRSPNILAVSVAGFGALLTVYASLVPLPFTIAPRYGITNQALIGLLYVPIGMGNFIGAPLAGRISDYIVVKYRAQRGGVWYPEDRLRATLIGAGVLAPLSVLFSGLLTQFVPGKWGLIGNLLCFFVNGLGVDVVLSPSAAYAVDIMHSRSAESMAAANGLRAFLIAISISTILPLIDLIGVVGTNALTALLAWFGFGILWLTIRYGEQMRAWVDMGYSTASTN